MDNYDDMVPENSAATIFDENRASAYDKQLDKIASLKDALHLCIKMVLFDLPSNARILCVGAGTGDELIYLAHAFPDWHFTVVEPAPAMMEQCRAKIDRLSLSSRCTYHQGYVESLPLSEAYDAATSILVSQFCLEPDKRRQFFNNISLRLCDGGVIVTADLSADVSDCAFDGLLDVWMRTMKYAGDTPDTQAVRRSMFYGSDILTIAPARDIEAIIKSGGFDTPILIYQFMAILLWYARKS